MPTVTPTAVPPTPTRIPAPTATSIPPSPTPFPPGATIYQTSDFSAWAVGNSGWKLAENTLVTDNTLDQNHPIWAPIPITLPTPNYAVTASIETVDQQPFGIIARDGYSFGVSGLPVAGSNLVIFRCCRNIINPAMIGTQEIGRLPFTPAKRTSLDYTAELKGTNLRLLVNGLVLDTADTTYVLPAKSASCLSAVRSSSTTSKSPHYKWPIANGCLLSSLHRHR